MHHILSALHGRMFEVMQVIFYKRRADLIRGIFSLKASFIDRGSTDGYILGILATQLCCTILLAAKTFHADSVLKNLSSLSSV